MAKLQRLLFVMVLLGMGVACRGRESNPTPSSADEAAIYTTVIRQLVTVDDTFGGTLNPSHIYILRQTSDQAGDPASATGESHLLDAALQDEISVRLASVPAEITWVDSREEVPVNSETGAVEDNGVIVTLGNVQWQEEDVVHVPGSIYIASLAAGGQTYVLERVDGAWLITGNTGVQWIS